MVSETKGNLEDAYPAGLGPAETTTCPEFPNPLDVCPPAYAGSAFVSQEYAELQGFGGQLPAFIVALAPGLPLSIFLG